MGAFTYALKDDLVDLAFGQVSYTPETNLQIALTTTVPTISTPGTEVTGGSYSRETVANNKTTWTSASGTGAISNAIAITFTAATASWGNVQGVEIYDNAGTTRLAFAALATAKTIDSGDTASFAIGDLDISFTGT
jgi:hypothetical protein